MQPGGGGSGEHGCTGQDHPVAAVRLNEDAPPHSTPPLPAIAPVASEEKLQQEEEQQQPAASLPEGPLVEVLARVPYKSLCRFRCVSKPWLALCSSRDICKRSPQTLSGFFFHQDRSSGLHFRNLSGRGPPLVDPSLSFLRESYKNIFLEHCASGLLLCSFCNTRTKIDYLVCNPATEEWTVLPPLGLPAQELTGHLGSSAVFLGFDAAAPSCFMVFALPNGGLNDSAKVAIYTSDSGQWTYLQSKWASGNHMNHCRKTVFLNGTLHLATLRKSIITVDTDGKVWREIQMTEELPSRYSIVSIGLSQGHLYAWQIDYSHDCQLHIWVLEDYGAGKWTLKHTVNVLELFGRHRPKGGYSYDMFAVHPDCNVIFLTDKTENKTVSYDLDNQEVDVICNEYMYGLPYIPCFAELPSAGH